MKYIKYTLLTIVLLCASSCTKYNIIETGLSEGKHNTTMWDYFTSDPYNWSLTQELIVHADLKEVFTRKENNLTFFGPTNHSIRRYLLKKEKEMKDEAEQNGTPLDPAFTYGIKDINKDDAKSMILTCVVPQRIMLDDIALGKASKDPETVIGSGGQKVKNMAGTELWIYTFITPFGRIPEAGAKALMVCSERLPWTQRTASNNIETLTGVVHSLQYNYTIGNL